MKTIEAKMEKTMEQKSASTAAPGSPSSQISPAAPKQVVVNHGFDKLFFAFSIPFIVVSLLVVSVSVFFAISILPITVRSIPHDMESFRRLHAVESDLRLIHLKYCGLLRLFHLSQLHIRAPKL